MPPYSTDPELSYLRHRDPDYIDSSELGDAFSDSTAVASDAVASSSAMASSPPKSDSMENDFHLEDYEGCDEPTDEDEDIPNAMNAITQSVRNFQSESTLRPGSFILATRAHSSHNLSPEKLIAAVYDDEKTTDIHLDERELDAVPVACQDLIVYESLKRRRFKLDLSVNKLVSVNKFLYEIRNLEYLSLRLNQIEELSPLIGQLTELKELHLGNNNLKTLPIELTQLHNLCTLTTYPNDFIPPPENGASEAFWQEQQVPSLVELAQRRIAETGFEYPYDDLESMLSQIVLAHPDLMLAKLLDPVLHTVLVGRICSICKRPVIKPFARHLHWKKHVEDRSGGIVPYQTTFCSGRCLRQHKASIDLSNNPLTNPSFLMI